MDISIKRATSLERSSDGAKEKQLKRRPGRQTSRRKVGLDDEIDGMGVGRRLTQG